MPRVRSHCERSNQRFCSSIFIKMKKIPSAAAVVLSGIFLYIFEKIWGNSIHWEKIREVRIGKILARQFTVLEILIFIALTVIFYFVGALFYKRVKSRYLRKQRTLMKYKRLDMLQKGIMFRWRISFDPNNEPYIEDLQAFCTKHKPPIRLIDNVCPVVGCENNKLEIDVAKTRNVIESNLINRWEQLNK